MPDSHDRVRRTRVEASVESHPVRSRTMIRIGTAGPMRAAPGLVAALAVLVAWLTLTPLAAAATDRSVDDRIDDFVADYLDTHRLPGATVALVQEGEVVHETGYGEDADGRQLTETSLMRIESVSKPITAFAVLQLVDQGRVGLDDAVVDHLPELRLDDDRAGDVTVRQLLSHTSGLVTPTIVRPAQTLEDGVARTAEWSLSTAPGTTYRYSNANLWIAARLVEVVSGQPFNDFLDDRIFSPAGMDASLNTTTTATPVPGLPNGHVTSYGLALPASDADAMTSGAGGVISTAHDMARWIAVQQLGGRAPDGTRLLSADLVEESHRIQPKAKRAGLGWARSTAGDPPRIQHSGAGTTYNAQVTIDPGTGYGAVVLLNSFTPTMEHAYAVASGILDIADGEQPTTGRTIALWVDLGLAALTVLALLGGARGVRRAGRWAAARREWRGWRFGLRLLPQLIAPAFAVFLFFVATALQDNSFTPVDAFWLYPAFMVLLLSLAVVGLTVVGMRVWHRLRGDGARAPS